MANNTLIWLIGALVVFILVIQVIIPGIITSSTGVSTTGSSSELFTGTAATAHVVANYPITSITSFLKAGGQTDYNGSKLTANGSRIINFAHTPIIAGNSWNAYNVTITAQVAAAGTENITNSSVLTPAVGDRHITLTRVPTAATFTIIWQGNTYDNISYKINGLPYANRTGPPNVFGGNTTNQSNIAVVWLAAGVNNISISHTTTLVDQFTNNSSAFVGVNGTHNFTLAYTPVAASALNTLRVIAQLNPGGVVNVSMNDVNLGVMTLNDTTFPLTALTLTAGVNNVTYVSNDSVSNVTFVSLNWTFNTSIVMPVNLTSVGLNTTYGADTVTWVTGCGYANRSASNGANTWTGMNSTCLGATTYPLTFVTTETGNVTNISVAYLSYAASTAYTLSEAAGTITPTASGYYSVAYDYGTPVTVGTQVILLILPLMVAVVALFLLLQGSGIV